MDKDERIKNFYTLAEERRNRTIRDFFVENQFEGIVPILDWIVQSIKRRIRKGEAAAEIPFSRLRKSATFKSVLDKGDKFYHALFESEDCIPEKWSDLKSSTPLTVSVELLYNKIWRLEGGKGERVLGLYRDLSEHLQFLAAKQIAEDKTCSGLEQWRKVNSGTQGLHGFYMDWTSNIPIKYIEQSLDELCHIEDNQEIHKLADLKLLTREPDHHSGAYAAQLKRLESTSSWNYVRESTHHSGQLLIDGNISLQGRLLLRLGHERWLRWLDNLRWPILQSHAYYTIADLAGFEKIISQIVAEGLAYKSKSEYLLLMALDHYYKLIKEISINLFHLQSSNRDRYEANLTEDMVEKAKWQYKAWFNGQMKQSYNRVLDEIFQKKPVSQSRHFEGVFDWINSHSKENHRHQNHREVLDQTLEALNVSFQERLNRDVENKMTVLKRPGMQHLNWQAFGKYALILQEDPNDDDFRIALFEKYLAYLKSDHFRWNTLLQFDWFFVEQACNLSVLLSFSDDPLAEWEALYLKYRVLHEGWKAPESWDTEKRKKDTFVLTVGAGLGFRLLEGGQKPQGLRVVYMVLDQVLSQSRLDPSTKLGDYDIVFQFLARLIGIFDGKKASDFMLKLAKEIDREECFLLSVYQVVVSLKEQNQEFDEASMKEVKSRIENNFWKIENKNSDPAKRYILDQYSQIRGEITE